MIVPSTWTTQLASAIAATLRELLQSSLKGISIAAIDLGCFPWHGALELSVLTSAELDADSLLADPSELAAWQFYNCSAEQTAWEAVSELALEMQQQYQTAGESERRSVVDAYLNAAASAVASEEVQRIVRGMLRDDRFRIRVTHPDDGRSFYPPQ